jgi:hypothetical protein
MGNALHAKRIACRSQSMYAAAFRIHSSARNPNDFIDTELVTLEYSRGLEHRMLNYFLNRADDLPASLPLN